MEIEEIARGMKLCLDNAEAILDEAILLFKNKKYSRSYFLTIIAIVLGWLDYGNSLGFVNENFNFSMISLKTLSSGLDRIPLILYEYQKHVFGFKKWNIIWVILLVLLAARFKKSVRGDTFYITTAIFIFFMGYSLVYILSTMDFNFLLTKTSSRFLLHILPVCVFWIACMTKEDNH